MANHKSAAKRARQTTRKTARNNLIRKTVRTFEKKLRSAIELKKSDEAKTLLLTFTSLIDKASAKGAYHANKASRTIGRLAKQVSALK